MVPTFRFHLTMIKMVRLGPFYHVFQNQIYCLFWCSFKAIFAWLVAYLLMLHIEIFQKKCNRENRRYGGQFSLLFREHRINFRYEVIYSAWQLIILHNNSSNFQGGFPYYRVSSFGIPLLAILGEECPQHLNHNPIYQNKQNKMQSGLTKGEKKTIISILQ